MFTLPEAKPLDPIAAAYWKLNLPRLLANRKVTVAVIYGDQFHKDPEFIEGTVTNFTHHPDGKQGINVESYGVLCGNIPLYISRDFTLHTITLNDAGYPIYRVWRVYPPVDGDGTTRQQREDWRSLWANTIDGQDYIGGEYSVSTAGSGDLVKDGFPSEAAAYDWLDQQGQGREGYVVEKAGTE